MRSARRAGASARSPSGVSASAARRFAIARSTLVQAVFCVRIAPTTVSNGVRAGHQPCGPQRANKAAYSAIGSGFGFDFMRAGGFNARPCSLPRQRSAV